jgi:colanic acid/amylovoran biosynthesis glycosyltransferase
LAATFHGHDVAGHFPQNRYHLRDFSYQSHVGDMFGYASRLICASQELADPLLRLGAPSAKLIVHHLGIDLNAFRYTAADQRGRSILMVGRMVEKKGMEYGIRAFAQLSPRQRRVRPRMIGDGPRRRSLERFRRVLALSECVDRLGAQTPKTVGGEMQQASLLLAPSVVARNGDRESGVIVLKEVAATGLATLGTRHGGIPEIVDHERTGLLVSERNVSGLASAMRALLDDEKLRGAMGLVLWPGMANRL